MDHGFSYHIKDNSEVRILRHGLCVMTLRGKRALDFINSEKNNSEDDIQEIMARLTGNYKRGNERLAKNHPRNR